MHDNNTAAFRKALTAIAENDVSGFESLLSDHPDIATERGDYRLTLLHEAASHGRTGVVQTLLNLGVSPDIRGNDDGTPLHWAASMGHLETVQCLVEAGANPGLTDGLGDGGTALVQALFYGHAETAAWLASQCREPDNLRVAAGLGDLDGLERLCDTPQAGASRSWYRPHTEFPDKPPTDDRQEILDEAFIYACANGHLDAARWLLDHGADVNGKPWYAPALHFAHWRERGDVVRWLVAEAGADLLIKDDLYDAYPWHWAHYTGQSDLALWLAKRTDNPAAREFLEEFPEG